MRSPLTDVIAAVQAEGAAVRVTLSRVEGSAPAPALAAMTVTVATFDGTIGGGALEHAALAHARRMLTAPTQPWLRDLVDYPLGPSLGQCCGGRATAVYERFDAAEAATLKSLLAEDGPPDLVRPTTSGPAPVRGHGAPAPDWLAEPIARRGTPLFLYGAGHVGRATVRALAGLPFEIFWIDSGPERFPDWRQPGLNIAPARDMAAAARYAPKDAWHVVMTYAHAIDFAVCQTVLERGEFAYLGLIASATKRARFEKRFREHGIAEARIARLHAPLGLPGLETKAPAEIAASIAADLLIRRQQAAETRMEAAE